jgi:hypothetical protein
MIGAATAFERSGDEASGREGMSYGYAHPFSPDALGYLLALIGPVFWFF